MEGRILSRTPSYDSWSSVGSDMSKAGLSRAMVDDAKWVQAQEERDLKLPRELQRAEERRAKMERGRARTMAARGQPARIDPARLQIRATAVPCSAIENPNAAALGGTDSPVLAIGRTLPFGHV